MWFACLSDLVNLPFVSHTTAVILEYFSSNYVHFCPFFFTKYLRLSQINEECL